ERMFVTTPTSLFVLLLLLFAAPPPTSFSPLSLDDALPIYQFHALRHRRPDRLQCPGLPLSSLPPGLGLGRGLPCRPGLCPRVRRSEERRVGKECRSRVWTDGEKKKAKRE